MMNRRHFLQSSLGTAAMLTLTPSLIPFQRSHAGTQGLKLSLPDLPYAHDALEPAIDTLTMHIHHGKHHQGYINNFNRTLESWTDSAAYESLESLFAHLHELPDTVRTTLRNNGGGAWNHELFWRCMTPDRDTSPSTKLAQAIDRDFGSTDALKAEFSKAAATRFGSGWAWLCADTNHRLFVSSTPNQDNPLMASFVDQPGIPLLGIDVWEHAYYLHYQNRRSDYISAFWDIINWNTVSERYEQLLTHSPQH